MYRAITATPLSPRIGAEIGHVDLAAPLAPAVQEELRRAFIQYQVIVFRDQPLDLDQLERLGRCFGDLSGHVGTRSNSVSTENPFVRRYHFDEKSKRLAERELHSDQSCAAVPPAGSLLYNHTLPSDGGGDTLFASMYAAYDALSDRMKNLLGGLTATHDGTGPFGPGSPVSAHPVVVTHPGSGRKAVFVNLGFTTHINELPPREGRALLQFLFDHCDRPEWTCRFRWQPHSIAVWDNRCTLHRAIFDYWPQVRSGFRLYVDGRIPPHA
ncbi:MAG: TauD/TfdA family dioxygenase [Pseudomonadota bacterium]